MTEPGRQAAREEARMERVEGAGHSRPEGSLVRRVALAARAALPDRAALASADPPGRAARLLAEPPVRVVRAVRPPAELRLQAVQTAEAPTTVEPPTRGARTSMAGR